MSIRNLLVGWMAAAFLLVGFSAQAGMIGTESIVAAQTREASLDTLNTFIARADVQQQLQSWGVEPTVAAQRVASLSDSELQQLAQNIQSEPAGAGILWIVGAVFVILIILELVGVTDIFKKI